MWQNGQVTVSTASGAAGPVEEFTAIGYDEAGMGGKFLKIGVGILKRDTDAYDFVHTYPVVNEGKRGDSATKTSVRLTQDLSDKDTGYGYSYVKTVRLVPGKAQMVIEHVLKNTGNKPIETSVYCHNFLTLSAGNENVDLTAPFNIKRRQAVCAPMPRRSTARPSNICAPSRKAKASPRPITGFGSGVSDYDFKVTNTKTGFGQRIRADQPLARINFWSIRTTFSWEPYIAISLKPGETKRWTYTYDYFGPGRAEMRRAALAAAAAGRLRHRERPARSVPGTLPATALEDFPPCPDLQRPDHAPRSIRPARMSSIAAPASIMPGWCSMSPTRARITAPIGSTASSPIPRDNGKYPPGTEHSCCAISGPVEEFAAVGFEEAGMGGRFLKPGIGIFKRDNDNPLKFPTLPALNEGKRTFKATKTSARFTQDLRRSAVRLWLSTM